MNKLLNFMALTALLVSLTACGSGGSSSSPTSVPNTLSVFYAHNLVFRNSTTLLSTGYNGSGQLGSGNLANRTTPLPISGSDIFKGQAAGGNHSVAFFNSSTVRSWGDNRFGQLGNETTTYSSVPTKTKNISNVVAVAAGSLHTIALKGDGTVWSWGDNSASQLGVPANTKITVDKVEVDITKVGYSVLPVQVEVDGAPLSNIKAIAASGQHSLALDIFGQVWAWGLNATGELGQDPTIVGANARPRIVAGLPADIVAIAAGGAFNYAVTSSGVVYGWGNNNYGQLGFVSPADKLYTHTPVPISVNGPAKVAQAAAGLKHGLFRLDDNSVWSIGNNHFGQLGINNQDHKSTAVQVRDSLGTAFLANATDIRAFGSSSMALIGGSWFVWGDNSYGQLGTGKTGTLLLPEKMSGF